ncbi:hypothetical protein L6E12_12625 [Actinokineospora sp. PR83]|uniref:hypothetical protein n=1 Tax=Actinokineospora sp. PR83 TaxID=2884908 RepID=UPI001F257157|nr:hypothetical protein [Actinokineospora sp. PR83]MCG8916635.1 hypothetical protein [Actinokineospora sp. PR83]
MTPGLDGARARLAAAAAAVREVRLREEDALAEVRRRAAANSTAAGATALEAAKAIDRSEKAAKPTTAKSTAPPRPEPKSYVLDLGPDED